MDRPCSFNISLTPLKPEHFAWSSKLPYYTSSFNHFCSVTNWKVSASLLPIEDNSSNSHQSDQLVPCCLLRSRVRTCSGWEQLGKSHRASDTEDASESYWHKELTGPLEWQGEGRSWGGRNNSNMDIWEVITRKMKEKLKQTARTWGQGDSSGLRRKEAGHEVKCSRGAKALWDYKEGKCKETQRKRKKKRIPQ